MFKVIGFYKKEEGIEEFIEYLKNVLIPRVLQVPGVIKVEYTDLVVSNSSPTPVTKDNDFAFMCEIYFASPEALQIALDSEHGKIITEVWVKHATNYMVAYVGKEEVYNANLFTNLRY
ncbi:EthD family reductase [Thermoactinomyces mirandus]|uniref:EthD family reductase n=1 Tax=Thermoactinomyces mirandus TaxID=2756294 RepID=A0A7W1XTW7_9BACL|nr:EthD family reductase [Thermoactinomyces mirandus]MBA4603222.1 EthD family reductase [Thermoactinomyces mirandus]